MAEDSKYAQAFNAAQRPRLIIRVMVGLSPGLPIEDRCRSWTYTSLDYERDKDLANYEDSTLKRKSDEATAYARAQMDPCTTNYVCLEWIWL